MTSDTTRWERRKIVPEMGGVVARWYARLRRSDRQMQLYRTQAAQLTDGLPDGSDVLEVAFGPGYHAIEMARSGRLRVTGLDISPAFVEIATTNARQAGVRVDFHQGDAADLPFEAESFDLIVCQAAFKNFTRPVDVLNEMRRVLRGGGVAVIQDLSADATGADVVLETQRMGLRGLNAVLTRATLTALRRRAYSPAQFTSLAARSAFRTCDVRTDGVGLEVRLTKPDAA
jgi:ubiquinone/menaquinone biosynthesis C-methylase UbiE